MNYAPVPPDDKERRLWARSVFLRERRNVTPWYPPAAPDVDWYQFLLSTRDFLAKRSIDTVEVKYMAQWAEGDVSAHEYRLMTPAEAEAENERYQRAPDPV